MKQEYKFYKEAGFNCIPVNARKEPVCKDWDDEKDKMAKLSQADGLAIVLGDYCGGVEAVDVDLKYDLTKTLWARLKKQIGEELLRKLTIQKTPSGGRHLVYRCEEIEKNQKLARRSAVAFEAAVGDKIKVLIETRGERGYILVPPSKGYELLNGTFDKINEITIEERSRLLDECRLFNEYFIEYHPPKVSKKRGVGVTPFDDYNERGDVIGLLEKHGWQNVGLRGNKTLMLRPGDTKTPHSGNFNHDLNWFSVFSTSTVFEAEKGYRPYAVFSFLECGGDFGEAARKLRDLGFGEDEVKMTGVQSKVSISDSDFSFLADDAEITLKLKQLRDGTMPIGLTTGIPALDTYFLWKRSNFNIINGRDNVGKSVAMWYLSLLTTMRHNWNWVIYSSENSCWHIHRKLIEFYYCKPIAQVTEKEEQSARDYIREHFAFIKNTETYNYMDLLNMTAKLGSKKKYDGMMIDPYNSLKTDAKNVSRLGVHDFHYEALSEMRSFGKNNDISININCHSVTELLRQKDSDGEPSAPSQYDTEGGGKFANKADDFMTFHRKKDHPTEFPYMDIHVRKVKEVETGGNITAKDSPVRLKMIIGNYGYECNGYNPILNIDKTIVVKRITETKEEEPDYLF